MSSHSSNDTDLRPGKAALWAGRTVSALVGALLLFSGSMKLVGGPELAAGFSHLQLPYDLRTFLGVIEIVCAIIYLVPHTAVLGAILLAGYMGGAMVTHLRIGEPMHTQFILGVLAWGGLWLREPRLRRILPLRGV
jgi:hypothetical protein